MHVTAIIPAKGNSRRLPGKNLMPFGGSTLVGHKVDQLVSCDRIDGVVVATNCGDIAAEAERHGASVRIQDDVHCDEDNTPLRDRWRNIVSMVETDVVVWAHCTNPLCGPDIYANAVDAFGRRDEKGIKFDSLCSVSKVQGHMWKSIAPDSLHPVPCNFDPSDDCHAFASTLEPFYFQNGAIFIQPRQQMLENGYFYGDRPMLFEIDQPYDIDIDTERDLELARILYAGKFESLATYKAEDGHIGRVLLDGVDVSEQAMRCCPDAGWVDVHTGDAGNTSRRYGRVQFIPEVAA